MQLESNTGAYYIIAFEGQNKLSCSILKESPASSDQADFETNFLPTINKPLNGTTIHSFASKVLPTGKKLFKRYHGIQESVSIGENTIIYTIPYTQVKIIGVDIMNASALDTVDLMILDTVTGLYSTTPSYLLNQFAFAVNISKDYFRQESNYDADLYQGMQIKIVYNSQSNKTIGINFNFSEVK